MPSYQTSRISEFWVCPANSGIRVSPHTSISSYPYSQRIASLKGGFSYLQVNESHSATIYCHLSSSGFFYTWVKGVLGGLGIYSKFSLLAIRSNLFFLYGRFHLFPFRAANYSEELLCLRIPLAKSRDFDWIQRIILFHLACKWQSFPSHCPLTLHIFFLI